MSAPEQTDDDVLYHLAQIQEHVEAARETEGGPTPWDYALPTSTEFRDMREECAMTRAELADEMGYSPQSIRNVEKGKAPGREFIQKALLALKKEWRP